MSDDEFTQHELHPSSPPSWDGAVWDDGSQPLWDDDASQTLWVPSPPRTLAQLPSAAFPRLTPPPIGFSASPTCVPVGGPSLRVSNDAPSHGDASSPLPGRVSSPLAHSGISPSPPHVHQRCSSSHAEPRASSKDTNLGHQSVRGARPSARRAALDSGRRTSKYVTFLRSPEFSIDACSLSLYVAGGILDSQTSDSQYLGWREEKVEIHRSSDSSDAEAADVELSAVDTSAQEFAHIQIELANTRRQLYEYVGRWALARAHISRLDQQLTGGTFRA